MLAHLVMSLLLAATDAAAPPSDEPTRSLELRPPEIRLLEGTFRLKLNSGWFRTGPARDELGHTHFDMDGALSVHDRRGRLAVAGGTERSLRLRIVWSVQQDQDMARVHSQIDLALLGHTFTLSPPDVRLRPRFDGGQPGVEVSIPLLEGSF